jgi:hypothetical protein
LGDLGELENEQVPLCKSLKNRKSATILGNWGTYFLYCSSNIII